VCDLLDQLGNHVPQFAGLFERMWAAADGSLYPLDLYATGAINRSLGLLSGFRSMIEHFNFACAAPLVRFQLDTALRFYAAFTVPDPQEFALQVLHGTEVRKLKDRSGQQLHDAYLVKSLSPEYPWVDNLYQKTSGYVHLSSTHCFNAVQEIDRGAYSIQWNISGQDPELPDRIYTEAINAFDHSAALFAGHLDKWIGWKSDPAATAAWKPVASNRPPAVSELASES
jgi:hypothetical protein